MKRNLEDIYMHIRKTLGLVLSVLIMCTVLVSCGEEENGYLDKDGNIPSYEMSEAPDGYYILKRSDKRCYTALKVGGVDLDDNYLNAHYWLLEDMEKAVPELTEDDQIVLLDTQLRPNSFTFVKMADYGYTVGTSFSIIDNTDDLKSPTIITFGDDVNAASPIGPYLDEKLVTGHENNTNVKLTTINGKEITENMLTDGRYFKSLTKKGMYKFTYYEGTKYNDINIQADSHLFVADGTYTSTSYAEMEDQYFVIAPAPEMENGYYYMDGLGLFYYSGATKSIGEAEKDIEEQ